MDQQMNSREHLVQALFDPRLEKRLVEARIGAIPVDVVMACPPGMATGSPVAVLVSNEMFDLLTPPTGYDPVTDPEEIARLLTGEGQ